MLQIAVDIPCFALGLVLFGTGYRFGSMFARAKEADQSRPQLAKHAPAVSAESLDAQLRQTLDFRVHSAILLEFLELFLDAPSIACAVLCLLVPWRAVFLVRDLLAAADDTIWRRRRLPIMHLLTLLLDIPCVALLLAVLASGYRARRCLLKVDGVSNWRCCGQRSRANDAAGAQAAADQAANYRVTGWDMSFGPDVHIVIVRQFIGFFFDLPFILMGAVTALTWRSCLMYRDMEFGARDRPIGFSMAAHRRIVCFVHFFLLFADIPTFVVLLLLGVSYYRLPGCARAVRTAKDARAARTVARQAQAAISTRNEPTDPSYGLDVHRAIWRHALLLLTDLPFIAMAAVVFCTGWRAYFMWSDLAFGRFSSRNLFM